MVKDVILKISLLGIALSLGLLVYGKTLLGLGLLIPSVFGIYLLLGRSAPGNDVPCDPREDMSTYNPKLI